MACLQNTGVAVPILFSNDPTGTPAGNTAGQFTHDPNSGIVQVSTPMGDFATKSGVQQEAYTYATDTGSANTYAVAQSPLPTLVAGSEIVFKASATNTGASTITLTTTNGTVTLPITKLGANALTGGEIQAGSIVDLVFDGTHMQIVGGIAAANPYHICILYVGAIPGSQQLTQWVCPAGLPGPVTLPVNFSTARGWCQAAPAATYEIPVFRVASGSAPGTTGSQIGSISVATNGTFTFSTVLGATLTFTAGDVMTAFAPATPDTSFRTIGVTIAGTR